MGLPFMPVRGILNTDYLKIRKDFRVIENPYDPEEKIIVVPAIKPDVVIFHAYKADAEGSILADITQNNRLMAQAAARAVLVTFEEIEGGPLDTAGGMFIPSRHVTAAVHMPGGAHPTSCPGYYSVDKKQMRTYIESSADPAAFDRYLQNYILGQSEKEYLESTGITFQGGSLSE